MPQQQLTLPHLTTGTMYIYIGSRGTLASWWQSVNAECHRHSVSLLRRCQRAAIIGNELRFVQLTCGQETIVRWACKHYGWTCLDRPRYP